MHELTKEGPPRSHPREARFGGCMVYSARLIRLSRLCLPSPRLGTVTTAWLARREAEKALD
jgi:hypothetical protein